MKQEKEPRNKNFSLAWRSRSGFQKRALHFLEENLSFSGRTFYKFGEEDYHA
jgi:hypothetical protein